MSPVGDPCNLKCPTPGKPALPAAPSVALQLSQHAQQPRRLHLSPRSLPSVRTLRLSLLQSLLAWLASPQPLERSLSTPGPPPNAPVVSSALSGAVYYGAHKSRPLPGPSPTTSQSKASGAPPRQSQSAGGALRLCPPPLPIPAAHVQGTKPVGLSPAVSSVPKTPPNCRPKGEGDAAGGERHPYLNLFASLAGLHEMVTPEALHKWGKANCQRGHE